jgi:hypothetical protein
MHLDDLVTVLLPVCVEVGFRLYDRWRARRTPEHS